MLIEYTGKTGQGKTRVCDRVRVYRQHIRQPKYQQLKFEEYFRICEKGRIQNISVLQTTFAE